MVCSSCAAVEAKLKTKEFRVSPLAAATSASEGPSICTSCTGQKRHAHQEVLMHREDQSLLLGAGGEAEGSCLNLASSKPKC